MAVCLFMLAATAHAQEPAPTQVMVRVVAQDAKLIGSVAGGARVVITEAETGRVLAEGLHEGGTGDTERIVVQPQARGATIYDTEGTAGFQATIELTRPTLVNITVAGPLKPPEATLEATHQMWLLPGAHVLGEGIVIPLHGFIVQVDDPAPPDDGAPLAVRATVTMLCTCPITPGGLWDADRLEVAATLRHGDHVVARTSLAYAGEASTFEGTLPAPNGAGTYTLEVTASDPSRANFGRAAREVTVR